MSLPDGKLAGLPYYAGHNAFIYNEEHLSKSGVQVPDGLGQSARCLPQAEEGRRLRRALQQRLGAEMAGAVVEPVLLWYADGAKVFDDKSDLVDDASFRKVLEGHRTLYKEPGRRRHHDLPERGRADLCDGRHTFMVLHDYDQKVTNDPKASKIAGKVKNALMPGKTQSTFAWTAVYLMGSQPVDVDRVWNLLQFFGGKAKDGQYHVIKRWALEFGLGSGYKEVMADPEVVASFSKWRDLDMTNKQLEIATSRKIAKTMWFPEWDLFMMEQAQEYIRGNGSLDQLVAQLSSKVGELKKQYQ